MWIDGDDLEELDQQQQTAAAFMLRDLLRRQISNEMLIKQREILPRLSIRLEVGIFGVGLALPCGICRY